MALDLFGIKIGNDQKGKEDFINKKLFEIPKDTILEKFGFEKEEVTYFGYNPETKKITIRTK